jgi:hypothetical protein
MSIAGPDSFIKRPVENPKVGFVEVRGGDPSRSEPCQALSAHGFLGKGREVVSVIADWVTGGEVPELIDP